MAEDEAYQAKEKSTEKQEEINSLTADLAATKLQWDELSGSRDPKHRYLMGTPVTLEKFPPIQDRDTDKRMPRPGISESSSGERASNILARCLSSEMC